MAINVDRGVDLLHDRIGAFTEAAAPHLVTHGLSLAFALALFSFVA
jgi:hypothetical protein